MSSDEAAILGEIQMDIALFSHMAEEDECRINHRDCHRRLREIIATVLRLPQYGGRVDPADVQLVVMLGSVTHIVAMIKDATPTWTMYPQLRAQCAKVVAKAHGFMDIWHRVRSWPVDRYPVERQLGELGAKLGSEIEQFNNLCFGNNMQTRLLDTPQSSPLKLSPAKNDSRLPTIAVGRGVHTEQYPVASDRLDNTGSGTTQFVAGGRLPNTDSSASHKAAQDSKREAGTTAEELHDEVGKPKRHGRMKLGPGDADMPTRTKTPEPQTPEPAFLSSEPQCIVVRSSSPVTTAAPQPDIAAFTIAGHEILLGVGHDTDDEKNGRPCPVPAGTSEVDTRIILRQRILDQARACGVREGTWHFYVEHQFMPAAWNCIVASVLGSRLTYKAEFKSVTSKHDDHEVDVYTRDIDDDNEIDAVFRQIQESGLGQYCARGTIYFKPLAYKLLGIRSGNQYNMPSYLEKRSIE